ncbi:MAG: nuclear transport factor 2 family protein [Alphaproteobacteria bacterium]|nr:nuclear transport factor 2 family protein [Alphaproteobacteria bacterium]
MSEQRAILGANQRFYDAFAQRDLVAMDRLWARSAAVVCIHPGWNALIGREQVMESWRSILGNANAPRVRCLRPTVHHFGNGAFVTCYEALSEGLLVATNIFVLEDGEWRMVHHQAGPTAESLEPEPEPPSGTVH